MTTEQIRDTQSDAGPEPLDPALLQAIRPSATRMAAPEGAFAQLLHEELGTLVSPLPGGGWPFCERTARVILRLALSDQPAAAAIQSLHRLGEANEADGFPQSEYVSISHALVRIAREMSGTKWTTTTGSAWIRFYLWLQPHLRPDARQQPARQEPARQDHEAASRADADVDVSAAVDLFNDEDEDEPATTR
jgi:hypothetical protein